MYLIRFELIFGCGRFGFFKTRSLAATSCRASKVRINGEIVKPSKAIREGDIVNVHKGKSKITVEVTAILEKRVSAKDALNYKRKSQ